MIVTFGLALLIRSIEDRRNWGGVIDASIIAVGLSLLSWVFLIKPYAGDETLPLLVRFVLIYYPLAGVVWVAMAARLLFSSRTPRPPSLHLLLLKLRSRLDTLDETRQTARRELEALRNWSESLETLERDKERLLESYATLAPEALEALDSEECRTVYSMLGLCVEALPDKSLKICGAFGEESLVCHHVRTSIR
ncbi:MAG: hypothetical protein M3122_05310 [Actinomycetota bacterium]|nr:hypothetical protein [Actinomycetota bacterium]